MLLNTRDSSIATFVFVCDAFFTFLRRFSALRCLLCAFFAFRASAQDSPTAATNPPAPPLITIAQFLSDAPAFGESVPVRLRGTVTHVISDRTYFIQDGDAAVYAFDKPDPPFALGNLVELTGYASLGGTMPTLQNCTARIIGAAPLPTPTPITGAEILNSRHGMKLVRLQGRVLHSNLPAGHTLFLRESEKTPGFQINLEAVHNLQLITNIEPGSLLEVVGVLIQRKGPNGQPANPSILLGSISNLKLIAGPPFWNLARVKRTLGLAGVALILVVGWVLLLRHQVKRQSRLIEQRFEREAALKALEDRFAKVFRAGPDGLIITRASDDQVLEANPAFESLTGFSQAQLVGRSERDLQLWQDEEGPAKALESIGEQGALTNVECILRSSSGTTVHCLYSAQWIDLNGQRCRLGVLRDITEQKRHEQERRALQVELDRTERIKSLGTLAAGIAHDFNNLLAAILGNADLARESGGLSRELSECLDEIRGASLRGRELVQRILAFCRPPSHGQVPLLLGPVVAEASSLLRAAFPPGVWLETHLDPNCPPVLADAAQIHQIVMNLGTNAGHAMEQKPGRVTISLRPVAVDPTLSSRFPDLAPGQYACLSVSDQGTGMTPEVRQRIFEPFFTTKPPGKGTGLGLAAVHGFVKSHRGAVDVQTDPLRGTTFSIFLPATDAPLKEAALSAPVTRPDASAGAEVLFVDDEEAVLSAGKRMLQRLGYNVTAFTDARDAIRLFEQHPDRFGYVLTDMNMPQVTGLDLTLRLRALGTKIPIILLSGKITDEARARARDAGVNRVLAKPVTLDELSEALRTEPAPAQAI